MSFKRNVRLLILMGCLFAVHSVDAQVTPPFTQCPAVGADTSCAILIVVTDQGISVATDPSQGPFDQIEDTLIGVQNNSSKTLFSLPLSSPDPIFGFDGDGLCSPFIAPQPAGCPFGPTGYEGPGVTFTSVASTSSSGIVNFSGGIPPGGSAYFSLELSIQTLCQPIGGVPLFKQFSAPWGPLTYDGYPVGDSVDTIKKWGCALTSSVMTVNYHAFAQGSSFRTDPETLNAWLSLPQNHGYVGLGALNWDAVAKYARINGVQLYYQNSSTTNDFILDNYLCTNNPTILQVTGPSGQHYIVATGETSVNGTNTFLINDPGYNNSNLLVYPKGYGSMRKYSSTAAPPSALIVSAHSPVELLVTDPNGRQTGLDPIDGANLNQIPGSSYTHDSIGDDENPSSSETTPEVKTVEISVPLSGQYSVQAIPTGTGAFSIDFLAYDLNAEFTLKTFTGTAKPGTKIAYNVGYSSTPGSVVSVVPVDTTPPTISIAATPTSLWPPNGKMVPVTIFGTLSDDQSGVDPNSVIFQVVDKYARVQPQGPVVVESSGNYSFSILLEASRLGTDLDGRTYTVIVSAKDNAGNLASLSTQIVVPHDQGKH